LLFLVRACREEIETEGFKGDELQICLLGALWFGIRFGEKEGLPPLLASASFVKVLLWVGELED
jgi:hypothetical protein